MVTKAARLNPKRVAVGVLFVLMLFCFAVGPVVLFAVFMLTVNPLP